MARTFGTGYGYASIEAGFGNSLDARANVPTKADLIVAANWVNPFDGGTYIYNGMTVTVAEDSTPANNGIYVLTNENDVTNTASWLFVGAASAGTSGSSGDSGTSGSSGNSGTSGSSGDSGTSGSSGEAGTSGSSGDSGTSGSSGEAGTSGSSGDSGTSGSSGEAGTSGSSGDSGTSGSSGDSGTSGSSGDSGTSGSSGEAGTSGSSGEAGTSGSSGDSGTSGSSGTSTNTYTNATPTPLDFPSDDDPNIIAGSTFSGKTFPEMMNLMLYPTLYPTLSNPFLQSVNLSLSGFQIIGTQVAVGNLTLSCTFNRGSINPAYGTNGFRSGDPNTYNYTSPSSAFVTSVSSTSLSNTVANTAIYTVASGTNSFSVSVTYDTGPQPLDSAGVNFDNPLGGGSSPPGSTSRSFTGVFPVFSTQTNYNVTDQISLQNMDNNDVTLTVIAEDGGSGNKQAISIPNTTAGQAGFTAFTDVKQEDPLNIGSFVPITGGLTTFTLTTETRTVEGVSRTYNLYTHNGSTIGSRKLKFIN